MSDFVKVIGGLAIGAAIVIFLAIFGTLAGIIGGWIVGLFFTDLIVGFIGRFGVNTAGLEVWQIGGVLGFLGGYFKSVQTSTSN